MIITTHHECRHCGKSLADVDRSVLTANAMGAAIDHAHDLARD